MVIIHCIVILHLFLSLSFSWAMLFVTKLYYSPGVRKGHCTDTSCINQVQGTKISSFKTGLVYANLRLLSRERSTFSCVIIRREQVQLLSAPEMFSEIKCCFHYSLNPHQ